VKDANDTGLMLEHLFRHQTGRIVAHLTRILGSSRLHLAEESAQEAMLRALQTWPFHGVPGNPGAWLFRVAKNVAIDAVRRDRSLAEKSEDVLAELSAVEPAHSQEPDLEEQLRDDELRMIFLCCHPRFSREVSVVLSLNTVGGFSAREIARSLLVEESAIAQRLVRAKRQIRDGGVTLSMPHGAEIQSRLDAALDVIYFLFNEGYASHGTEQWIRQDLCLEALRLARLLASSSIAAPRVHALVALIALQAARLPARLDAAGDLVLLEQQDRSRWDQKLIALGFRYFEQSIGGDEVSPYHVEAAIAATHARAIEPDSADWPLILSLYDQLLAINPSPVVALNRAVAFSRVHGAAAALALIQPLEDDPRLRHYHLFLAVRGHLLFELGRRREAALCFEKAIDCGCSLPERRFLTRRLAQCG
jgi:RNA polymerase sigma-70 factor (ECF subfamily)